MKVPSVYDMDNILVSLMLTNCTKFKLHLNFLENYSHLENTFSIHIFGRGGGTLLMQLAHLMQQFCINWAAVIIFPSYAE